MNFRENWLLSSIVCRDCKLFWVMEKGSDYTQTWFQKIYKSESHSPAADKTLLTPLSGRSSTETTDMFAICWNRFIRFLSFRGSISSFMMQKMSSDSDSSSHDRLSCNKQYKILLYTDAPKPQAYEQYITSRSAYNPGLSV